MNTIENPEKIIEKALDEIRPFLEADGGDVSFVSFENNKVKIKFEGACISCSVNQMTLKGGIESTLRRYLPEVEVIEVKEIITE